MPKPIHEMSQWDASVHSSRIPEEEWLATRELTHVATQILTNRDEYLAPERREIGRRIGEQQHEMFVVCDPAEALQQFESYLANSGAADRQVSGWIAELKRRVGDVAQTAEVQP